MHKSMDFPKRIIFLLVGFFLVAAFCFPQKDYTWEEKELVQRYKLANANYEKGKGLFLKGDYGRAEKEFSKCLERMPEHNEAHFLLSQIYYKWGNLEKSLEHIEKAKQYFSFVVKILVRIQEERFAELRDMKDKAELTLAKLRELLADARSDEERRKLEAQVDAIQQQISTMDNRLIEPLPIIDKLPADYFYYHGNIFFKLKRYQEAHDQYIEAVRIDPLYGNAHNNLATLYYMTGQYEKALQSLQKAEGFGIQVNPELKKAILKALENKNEARAISF